jgi:serine/threonine protein kinase
MSPERMNGQKYSFLSDIWSLGIIFIYLFIIYLFIIFIYLLYI